MAIKTASTRKITSSSTLASAYSSTVVIRQVVITDSNYDALDDTTVSSAGGYIKIFGIGFMSGYSLYYNGVAVATSTLINSNEIRAVIPSIANGTYNLTVFNTNNTGALYVLTASGFPTWTTSSYSSVSATLSVQLLVSGDAPLTYTLQGGSSLPSGISLSSSGLLSGTITGLTGGSATYTFTIIVTDAQLQNTQQSITLNVNLSDAQFMYTTLLLNGEGTAATNNAQNNTIIDSSTSAIAITRNGAIVQGSFSPFNASSWSNYFDGTGDYLTVPNINFGTNPYTIEGWFYITAASVPSNINFWGMNNGSGNNPKMILVADGSQFQLLCGNGTSADIAVNHGGLAVNRWHHIAVVREGTSANQHKIYLNGTALNSTSTAFGSTSVITATFNIGYVGEGFGSAFQGYISNFRIVNGTAVYTTTFTPSTTPLTAVTNTSLLTCQSNRFRDASTNAFTITRNGDVNVQKFSPFNGTTSYDPLVHGGSVYYSGSPWIGFSQPALTSVFTIESWLYFPAINSDKYLYVGSGGTGGPLIRLDATGGTLSIGRQGGFDFTVSTPYPIGQWFHFAHVREGTGAGQTKVYFNGVLAGSGQSSNTFNAGAVGLGSTEAGGQAITGYISGWRIVPGTAVYTSAFTPPTAPATAISGTGLLLNFTNAGIIDQIGMNNLTTGGDAKISTAVKKYNSGSVLFDGTGDSLTIASSPLLAFGTGDFTIEMWVYFTSITGGCTLYDARDSGNSLGPYIGIDGGSLGPYLHVSGANRILGTALSNATWYHIAVSKASGSTKLFVNGTQSGSTYTDANSYIAGIPTIGNNSSGGGGTNYLNGYIDDFRITKGFARYTANFTAPSSAFLGQ
jgi:hypothetical protein